MLSKIWYLAYVEKPPTDIIQNIWKDILDFLWNYKKVRVNRNTITLPIEMGGLVILDIETQCEAIQCSILARSIKEKNQNKTCTDLMLRHLDQYRKAKEGVNIFKTYISYTERTPILPTYKTFLCFWSSLTGTEMPTTKSLAEIYNQPIFFNAKSDGINNPSMFLNKRPPAWTKVLFMTIKDLCTVTHPALITADEFVKPYTPCKHIHNPGYLGYLEILKLFPKDKAKIKQNTALPEQDNKKKTFMRHSAMIFTVFYTKER